ncbi:MAG: hypothetical protein WKF55_14235 [Gemmatimonadaceae bacterium]
MSIRNASRHTCVTVTSRSVLAAALWVAAACARDVPLPTSLIVTDNGAGATATNAVVGVSTVSSLRAAIRNAQPFQQIQIAPGVYDLGDEGLRIASKNDLEIFGAGRGKTIIRLGPNILTGFNTPGNVKRISIAHMTIQGTLPSNVPTAAIATDDDRLSLTSAKYYDLEIKDVAVGISLVSPRGGQCSDIAITGNSLDNIQDFVLPGGFTRGSGYGIHNENCWRVRIADNVIRNADRHAIYQALQTGYGGVGVIIENNLILDHASTPAIDRWYLTALDVWRSQGVVVANNLIVGPAHAGLGLGGYETEDSGPRGPLRDVYFIGNTVLGAGQADVHFGLAWSWLFWGNRFGNRDAGGMTGNPRLTAESGRPLGALEDPKGFPRTQRVVSAPPFGSTYVMQDGKLHALWNGYQRFAFADPGEWPRTTMPGTWTDFNDMTAGNGRLYVIANDRLTEVTPGSWAKRVAPFPLNSVKGMAVAGSFLYVLAGDRIHRIDPTSWSDTIVGARVEGRINGMAVYGGVAFIMADNVIRAVDLGSL